MDDAINRVVSEIAEILSEQVHSFWLYGSVVLNDFRLGWSDIDFVAFTKKPITEEQAKQLLMLRQTLKSASPDNSFYSCFEGALVCLQEYQTNSYTKIVYWGTTGQRIIDFYEIDVFSRYNLAKYGKNVYGKADRGIFVAPSKEELVTAVQNHYTSIRKYAIRTNESIYSCGWLLDIARCIYTLRYYDIISKTQAGQWALDEHIFPDEEPLRRVLKIRSQPLEYKNNEEIKKWLSNLGSTVQQYADVLGAELSITRQI